MNRTMTFLPRSAGALAVAAAVALVPAALPQGNASALRAEFDRADLNSDGFLDVVELARAFRGPDAKLAPPLYDEKGRPTPALAQASSQYPDLVFLWAADKDGDQRVSWKEYQDYSRDHAAPLGQGQAANARALQAAFPQGFQNQLFWQRQRTPYVYAPNRQLLRGYGIPAGGLALGYLRPGPGAYQPFLSGPMTPLQRLNAQFAAELAALGNPDPMSDTTRVRYPWLYNQAHMLQWLGQPPAVRARMPAPMFTMPLSAAVSQPFLNNYLRTMQAAARNNQRTMQAYVHTYQRSVQAAGRNNQRALQAYARNRQRAVQTYLRNYQQRLRANQAMRQRQLNALRSRRRRR